MVKTFFVAEGHLAHCDGLWYGPDILLVVEAADIVDVHADVAGMPGALLGRHGFRALDASRPPRGLVEAPHPATFADDFNRLRAA